MTRDTSDQVLEVFREIDTRWDRGTTCSPFASLSPKEQVFALLFYLDIEVENGGFEQFLSNPTGQFVKETQEAADAIGDHTVAKLIGDAANIIENCRQNSRLLSDIRAMMTPLESEYTRNREAFLARLIGWWHRN